MQGGMTYQMDQHWKSPQKTGDVAQTRLSLLQYVISWHNFNNKTNVAFGGIGTQEKPTAFY